ncbi:hypothetical protein RFI_33707, partial [Reticulomyxa filosa]
KKKKKKKKKKKRGLKKKYLKNCCIAGRGVVALDDLNMTTPAMCIPRKIMLTLSRNDAEKIRDFAIYDDMCQRTQSLGLVLYVWYERMREDKSYFKHYLDCLPLQFDNLPQNWPLKDIAPLLSDTILLDTIIRIKLSHLARYLSIREKLTKFGIQPVLFKSNLNKFKKKNK